LRRVAGRRSLGLTRARWQPWWRRLERPGATAFDESSDAKADVPGVCYQVAVGGRAALPVAWLRER
jgi:hypothetical protein